MFYVNTINLNTENIEKSLYQISKETNVNTTVQIAKDLNLGLLSNLDLRLITISLLLVSRFNYNYI